MFVILSLVVNLFVCSCILCIYIPKTFCVVTIVAGVIAMETGTRWEPFKELCDLTQQFALNKTSSAHSLKLLLRKYKPDFLSLLKNQPQNSDDRAAVKSRSGSVALLDPKIVNNDFIEEALILSDLFQLNEVAAVDLLIAGEQQEPNYTGLSRGLVAVMLYWDGRRNLVTALRTLIQCRKGKSWTLDLNDDASFLAMSFTNEILANGMVQQILKLLVDIKVEAEIDRLSRQRGLGGARHRRQVRDLITEVRQGLADCLFYFTGQSTLPQTDIILLIEHLRQHTETESDGKLSPTSMALLFALLYAIKVPVDALVEQDEKMMEDLLAHPIIADKNVMLSIQQSLVNDRNPWKIPCVRACAQTAWALTFRGIAQSPLSNSLDPVCSDLLEQDENILEAALSEGVFLFMKESIVSSNVFHAEEFYIRRMHEILTDLIVNMPLKMKEMRNHGDEVARIMMLHLVQGEEPPPDLRRDFQHLMELITAIYNKDILNLQLSADYWCRIDQGPLSDGSFVTTRRFPHKQMSLSKFIRQSGDILPPLLYIPYLHMIAALSTGPLSARAAFEMLKSNGMAISGNGETLISWDHFFMSCHRYLDSLRQDRHVFDVTSPFVTPQSSYSAQIGAKPPAKTCTITPQEVEGLRAVMQLVAKIASCDDIACVGLYEDNQWCVCSVLFGLLQCPVPIVLKGDILVALSQLGRIPDISMGLLQAAERSQIIQTQTTSEKAGGLAIELEEVESRDEEYPMTQGFVKLLGAIADLQTDRLGDAFHAYLVFVVECVFTRIMMRAYVRPEEKWELASSCLLLFNRILVLYQPLPEHFYEQKAPISSQDNIHSSSRPSEKLPGFSLLLYIYNEGNFFKTIMQIVDECIHYLSSYVPKDKVEGSLIEATERSMQLLLISLELQDPFSASLRGSGSSLLVTHVDKLLFSINPRTEKADYITTIASFISHNATHPQLSLLSIRILSWLCSSTNHPQLVTTMMNSCSLETRKNIIQGFVEILDSATAEAEEDMAQSLLYESQLAIVRMMIQCIDQPPVNFSHLLLGFDSKKQPRYVNIQDPGVLGSSRSCLHSVLSILSITGSQPTAVTSTPKLAELCYQLIYRLASNTETTEPTLRYLRSSYDFFYKHLQCLPFDTTAVTNSSLMQQSWLLKTAAIELHGLAAKQQRTNTQRIIQVLYSQPMTTRPDQVAPGINHSVALSDLTLGESALQSTSFLSMTPKPVSTVIAMIRLFDIVDLNQAFPAPLVLDQFVPSVVEEGIKSCESNNEHGVVFCDIKTLHRLLESSLNTLSVDDINRKRLARHDMQNILQTAVERNKMRESLHGKLHFLSSWKQALEISLTSCPDDILPKSTRRQVLFAILQYIVKSVLEADAVQELTSPIAALALTLVLQIRSSLMASLTASRLELDDEGLPQDIINYLTTFQVTIRGIVEWLLQSGTNQKIRIHLYASLLHYLQLCQHIKQEKSKSSSYTGLRAASDDVYAYVTRENTRLFKDHGESFKDLLCKDAFNGHSICRVLAFGCLDSLLQIDNEQLWLQFMIKNGYINHIASSFLDSDTCLQKYLNPSSGPIRAVYIYEQKMALLCSIVHSPGGARAIIDGQVLPALSKCGFLDMRPSTEYGEESSTMNGLSRYRQLLFPVLHLCSALLTELGGPSHHEACALVLEFILSHHQALVSSMLILSSNDLQTLTELKLITGILGQSAGQDFGDPTLYPNVPQAVLVEIQAHLLRIQRQMLYLLPQFLLSDEMLTNMKSKLASPELYEQTVLLMHEIAANILTYCRVIITHSSDSDSALLFSPEIAEAPNTSVFPNDSQKPSLSLLVQLLRQMLGRLLSERALVNQLEYKVENIDTLSSQDLKEILVPHTDVVQLSVPQEQKMASQKLKETIEVKSKLTQCLLYVLENCMYLLWQHTDYYLLRAVAMETSRENILYPSGADGHFKSRMLQDLSNTSLDARNTLRRSDIDKLKAELPSCITDSFLKKLSSAETKGSFIQPLVRRMQYIRLQLS